MVRLAKSLSKQTAPGDGRAVTDGPCIVGRAHDAWTCVLYRAILSIDEPTRHAPALDDEGVVTNTQPGTNDAGAGCVPESDSGGATTDAPAPPSGIRRDLIWIAVIFLIALALRGVYLYQVRSSPFFGHEVMDPQYHRQWGEAVAAGDRFVDGPYFRAPLYPGFLGVVYRLFGPSDFAPRIIQIVVGSLSCVLLYAIGRRAFGRSAGALAGLGAAGYGMFLYFEAELLVVWLAVFLDLLLIWLLLLTADRPRPWLWLISGCVLGLSGVARPTILLFAPGVLVWLIVMHWPSRRRLLGYGACFVIGCILPIAPVTVRNYVVGQDVVLVSSSSGVNFFIGNNPGADGMTAIVPGTPPEWWAGYYAQIERAERAAGRPLKPSEVSGYYWREALNFMRDQPAQAAALMLNKLGLFWSRWEVSNNQDIRFMADKFGPVLNYLPLSFRIVGPLGLLGLVISLGQARRLFPLWGFVLIYMVGVVMFFVTARYRLPVVPVLLVFAGGAVLWLVDTLRARRWRAACPALVVLLLAGAVVSRVPEGVEVGYAQSCSAAGIVLAGQGRTAEAQEYLLESVERFPGLPESWFTLGLISMQQEDWARAEEYLAKAVALKPDHVEAHKHLGFVLGRQGKFDGAIRQFMLALPLSEGDATLYTNLGGVLIQCGRMTEGLDMLHQAVRLDPESARRFEAIAGSLTGTGRFADAVRVLEGGLAIVPEEVGLLAMLAKLLASCPDPAVRDGGRALQCGQRACELSGFGDPSALDALAADQFVVGHREQAAGTARRAVELATQKGDPVLAAQIRRRLRMYEEAPARPQTAPGRSPGG